MKAFSSIYVILPSALDPGVYSTSNIIEYQKLKKVSGKKNAAVAWADNLTAILEPIV
jgi:hypothetical protein